MSPIAATMPVPVAGVLPVGGTAIAGFEGIFAAIFGAFGGDAEEGASVAGQAPVVLPEEGASKDGLEPEGVPSGALAAAAVVAVAVAVPISTVPIALPDSLPQQMVFADEMPRTAVIKDTPDFDDKVPTDDSATELPDVPIGAPILVAAPIPSAVPLVAQVAFLPADAPIASPVEAEDRTVPVANPVAPLRPMAGGAGRSAARVLTPPIAQSVSEAAAPTPTVPARPASVDTPAVPISPSLAAIEGPSQPSGIVPIPLAQPVAGPVARVPPAAAPLLPAPRTPVDPLSPPVRPAVVDTAPLRPVPRLSATIAAPRISPGLLEEGGEHPLQLPAPAVLLPTVYTTSAEPAASAAITSSAAPAVDATVHARDANAFELATERLGLLRVALDAGETSVRVHVTADRSATAGLIVAQGERLQAAVELGGHRLAGLSVDVRDGGSGQRQAPSHQPSATPSRLPPPPAKATRSPDRFA